MISAPMPRLKAAQRWVLDHVLGNVALHDAAHGFAPGRSIVSAAGPHVGADVVVNLDLKDFFPTVSYRRVRGMFRQLGYSEAVATTLAMLCTHADKDEIELDGTTYFVGRGERHLPQGSPASPAVTNVICRRLDSRLTGLADTLGFCYTRYADDITFSGSGCDRQICNLLRATTDIVAHEGFAVHPGKTRVMRRARRQEVTGLVVNDKLGVERKELRRFRALLFQVERDGPDGKHFRGVASGDCDLLATMHGFAAFVAMVDAAKGEPLLKRVRALLDKHRHRGAPRAEPKPPRWQLAGAPPPAAATEDEAPETEDSEETKKPWWKFW